MNEQQNLHSGCRWEPDTDGSTAAETYASPVEPATTRRREQRSPGVVPAIVLSVLAVAAAATGGAVLVRRQSDSSGPNETQPEASAPAVAGPSGDEAPALPGRRPQGGLGFGDHRGPWVPGGAGPDDGGQRSGDQAQAPGTEPVPDPGTAPTRAPFSGATDGQTT